MLIGCDNAGDTHTSTHTSLNKAVTTLPDITTALTSPRYECVGVESPHIALPLNVGFAHGHNVSDVIKMFTSLQADGFQCRV